MWKNIGIRWKLLLGYGFLLVIFALAIAYSWVKIETVRKESQFLAQSSVPSMQLGSDIERNAYELFYAMRGFRYKEDEENLKIVREHVTELKKEQEIAKERYAADSRLLGLKPIVEDVVPVFETYMQNIAAVAQEQAASSKKVATAIDSTMRTTMAVVDTIEGIRHASEETAHAAQNVAEQSQAMSEYSLKLEAILSRFQVKDEPERDAVVRLRVLHPGTGA